MKGTGKVQMKELLKEHIPFLDDKERALLEEYAALLIEGNSRMNLTAITNDEDIVKKHFLDSLYALDYISQNAKCIDIGSGAGLPGIPLLIARPDIKLTMMDSLKKRVGFLNETLLALKLNATALHARAEDLAHDNAHRAHYDIALSRAVAPLNVLMELSLAFLRVGGTLIAYKGSAAQEEAEGAKRAAEILGAEISIVDIGAEYGARALILVKKLIKTPGIYPRKAGTPSKQPL